MIGCNDTPVQRVSVRLMSDGRINQKTARALKLAVCSGPSGGQSWVQPIPRAQPWMSPAQLGAAGERNLSVPEIDH
jgi:hypothetical protein